MISQTPLAGETLAAAVDEQRDFAPSAGQLGAGFLQVVMQGGDGGRVDWDQALAAALADAADGCPLAL